MTRTSPTTQTASSGSWNASCQIKASKTNLTSVRPYSPPEGGRKTTWYCCRDGSPPSPRSGDMIPLNYRLKYHRLHLTQVLRPASLMRAQDSDVLGVLLCPITCRSKDWCVILSNSLQYNSSAAAVSPAPSQAAALVEPLACHWLWQTRWRSLI